jgi:hypothetical protein
VTIAAGRACAVALARALAALGAGYDGLVALEARAHHEILFTRDARAQDVYRRLGVAFRAIA